MFWEPVNIDLKAASIYEVSCDDDEGCLLSSCRFACQYFLSAPRFNRKTIIYDCVQELGVLLVDQQIIYNWLKQKGLLLSSCRFVCQYFVQQQVLTP